MSATEPGAAESRGTGSTGTGSTDDRVLDCSAVIADVWTFLDHECDDASRTRLQRHLDDCGPCLTAFGIEEQIKKLLGRKCGEHAPAGLRDKLTDRIRVSVSETLAD